MRRKNSETVSASEIKTKKHDKKEKNIDEAIRFLDGELNDGEKIIKAYKPSCFKVLSMNLAKPFILYLICLIVSMCLYFNPVDNLPREDVLFVIYFLSGLFLIVALIVLWLSMMYLKKTFYVLTNQRVLINNGVFYSVISSISLEEIEEIRIKRTVIDVIFKTGKLELISEKIEGGKIVFSNVKNVAEVRNEIEDFFVDNK